MEFVKSAIESAQIYYDYLSENGRGEVKYKVISKHAMKGDNDVRYLTLMY